MRKIIPLLFIACSAIAQTTYNNANTGGAFWNDGTKWTNGAPSDTNPATVTYGGATSMTLTGVAGGSNVVISGLDLTSNATNGTGIVTIRSWQSASTETQSFDFNKAAAGNVAINNSGTSTGVNIINGRLILTDSIDITATRTLQITLAAGTGGAVVSGTGSVNILDGQVNTVRNLATDAWGSRNFVVGDGTGAAGSAILQFSQSNMFTTTNNAGNDSTMTVKSDGKFQYNTAAAGANLLGKDATAATVLTLHGGAEFYSGASGTAYSGVRNDGSVAALKVANVGTTAANITGNIFNIDLAATAGTGTRIIDVAKNTASGSADLVISALVSDGDDNMTYNKTGSGIIRLTADNSVSTALNGTGGWNIQGGGLLVDNTTGSGTGASTMSVTIGNGAALGGDGAIAGNISFQSGANLYFSTTQTLNVNGNVTFANFGVVNLVGLDSSAATATYLLLDGTGANIDQTNVLNIGLGNAYDLGASKVAYFDFTNGDMSLIVSAAAVPEPSTYAILAGLTALGLVSYRRRFQKHVQL